MMVFWKIISSDLPYLVNGFDRRKYV